MILCVDPDPAARTTTREALSEAGFTTDGRESLAAACDALREEDVDCLVTEQTLPDGSGLELVEWARELAPDAVCVLYTDRPLDAIDTDAFGHVVVEYLRKGTPNATDELVALVEHGLAFRSQTAYPLPQNEDARVAALERYTPDPEALGDSLARFTALAASPTSRATGRRSTRRPTERGAPAVH
ncbi:MAG: response regulator [Haloferacaceae archaeon]